jgi:hypothetical protein
MIETVGPSNVTDGVGSSGRFAPQRYIHRAEMAAKTGGIIDVQHLFYPPKSWLNAAKR